jgi:transcriptional regulator with GAF, ATPase, and Fis domain
MRTAVERWEPLLATDDIPPRIPGATMAEIERYAIIATLKAARGSTALTARMLGLSVRKVQYRLSEYAAEQRERTQPPSGSKLIF